MHRVIIKAKGVTINNNRELVLKLLDESLKAHGLKEEETVGSATLLTPQAEEKAANMLKRMVGKAEEIGAFKIGATGKLLTDDVLQMDDVGERLLQEITNDWIDALAEAKYNANKMEKFEISSMRILISEIYIRLVGSALRKDHKLPPTKNRDVWVDVMQTFVEKLKNDRYSLKIEKKFDDRIKIIHIRWAQCIRAVVSQLNEIEQAKHTISSNIEYLNVHQMQVMRYLVAAIYGKEGAKGVPLGSLAPRQIIKTLERAYRWKIDRYIQEKGREISLIHSESVLLISGEKNNQNKINLNLALERGVMSQVMSKRELTLQNTLLSITEDVHVNRLIGLLNLTRMIMGLVDRISRVVELGGWVPILLNMMNFEEVDKLIDRYLEIYKCLIDPTVDQFGIAKTDLYKELGNYAVQECRYDRSKIQKMKDLQAEELLERIRDKLADAYVGVMQFGKALNCNIVPVIEAKMPATVDELCKADEENSWEELEDKKYQQLSLLRLNRMYGTLIAKEDTFALEEKKSKDKPSSSPKGPTFIDKIGQRLSHSASSKSLSHSSSEGGALGSEELEVKLEKIDKAAEKASVELEDLKRIFSINK